MPSFNDFPLQPATRMALAEMEITEPTPIQAEAIPALLAGKDLVGQSATGSGKTLAYGVPLVERLAKNRRVAQALVLVPTRELAVQVNAVLSKLATSRRLSTALLVGGRPYGSQISALRYGSQIVVGTPGRVKDHLDQGTLVMGQLRMCVLDEADQMLDSGFGPVIEEILSTTPDTRQMALFSATMPDWVAKIQEKFLKEPVNVEITPATGGQSTIEQITYQVTQDQKMAALCTLLSSAMGESSLIFGRTKYGVEKLGKQLGKLGYAVGTLHGNKSQRARDEVLTAFRRGHVQTLLATDVAARGLDIKGIHQVINYELPESSELFTHRIGRTGRMGRQGKAITLLAPADLPKWRRMARNLGQKVALQRLTVDEEASIAAPPMPLIPTIPVIQEQPQRPIHLRKPAAMEPEQRPMRASRPARVEREQSEKRSAARSPRKLTVQEWEQQEQGKRERPHIPVPLEPEFGKFARSKRGHQMPSASPKRRRNEFFITREADAWQPEAITQPERPIAGKARHGRRVADEQPESGRIPGKRKARAFTADGARRETNRKRPSTSPSIRARRSATSRRSTGR